MFDETPDTSHKMFVSASLLYTILNTGRIASFYNRVATPVGAGANLLECYCSCLLRTDMLPNACLQIPFALVKSCNILSVNCPLEEMRRCILEDLYSEMLVPTSFIILISNVIIRYFSSPGFEWHGMILAREYADLLSRSSTGTEPR